MPMPRLVKYAFSTVEQRDRVARSGRRAPTRRTAAARRPAPPRPGWPASTPARARRGRTVLPARPGAAPEDTRHPARRRPRAAAPRSWPWPRRTRKTDSGSPGRRRRRRSRCRARTASGANSLSGKSRSVSSDVSGSSRPSRMPPRPCRTASRPSPSIANGRAPSCHSGPANSSSAGNRACGGSPASPTW